LLFCHIKPKVTIIINQNLTPMKHFIHITGKFIALICLTSFVLTFTSCKKNEENLYLHNKQDATQFAFADEDKTAGFTFTAKNSWVVFAYEVTTLKSNDVSWVQLFCNEKVVTDGRAGTFTIDIVLETNYTGETRVATIEIASGSDKIFVTIIQSGKNKDGETPEPEPVVIDVTDAVWGESDIVTLKIFCNGEQVLVSTEVAETGYKITLPNPEKIPISLENIDIFGLNTSNPNAKFAIMFGPVPYDKDGRKIGFFILSSEADVIAEYMYFDRDCNVKGKSEGNTPIYADCNFKKGWNLCYQEFKKIDNEWVYIWTTEKPLSESFAWRLWIWGK